MKTFNIDGQLNMFPVSATGCSGCICSKCLHKMKGDCPEGSCYDDRRAKDNSYIEAHHGKMRTFWSNWKRPGEQDHWCRGGFFYNQMYCSHFVEYLGQQIKECLYANVSIFQDGYIDCPLVDSWGCEECYRRFLKKQEDAA